MNRARISPDRTARICWVMLYAVAAWGIVRVAAAFFHKIMLLAAGAA